MNNKIKIIAVSIAIFSCDNDENPEKIKTCLQNSYNFPRIYSSDEIYRGTTICSVSVSGSGCISTTFEYPWPTDSEIFKYPWPPNSGPCELKTFSIHPKNNKDCEVNVIFKDKNEYKFTAIGEICSY